MMLLARIGDWLIALYHWLSEAWPKVLILVALGFMVAAACMTWCGCSGATRGYEEIVYIEKCRPCPETGKPCFACDERFSETRWCAGTALWIPSIFYWEGNECEIHVCEDKAALRHEVCHCACMAQGLDYKNGSDCMRACEAQGE